jgi:putative endonuclease
VSLRAWIAIRAPGLALRLFTLSAGELGLVGEELAARAALARGYRLLGRRLRTKSGEIDLCAQHQGTLVALEVKTTLATRIPAPMAGGMRLSSKPLSRWQPEQARRLEQALAEYARAEGYSGLPRRIDAVEVVLEAGRPPELRFLQGIR